MIFTLELEIFGAAVQRIHQSNKKMAATSEEFLGENDFETVLATFRFYNYDPNSSEGFCGN